MTDRKPLSVVTDEFQRESMRLHLEKLRVELEAAEIQRDTARLAHEHHERMFSLREKRQRLVRKH